jgi:large subunit ribosomal protein L10
MSKLVKDTITRELADRYGAQTNAVWVELVGIDGITTNDFRRDLRSRHMRLEIVKTSLFKRALSGRPLGRLADNLEGPAALLTGGETAIDVAKMLQDWLPRLQKLRVRGALLEGEFLDEARCKDLARMPSKRDLQGQLVGMILAPGANVVSAILAGGGNLAGCLKVLIEKLEKGEAAAPAAAPAEPAAAPAESSAAPA